jgi:UDP-N-acetyl-2-amino-2-deoxyglucuronate dehydrogenase
MKPIGYGIVGCGGAAVDVAAALDRNDEARLVATFDASAARAAAVAGPRSARVHETLEAMLADDEVDAVYIALPHDLLAPTSSASLRAGRDVLVEKPAATTASQALELARLADSLSRLLGVMFEFRASAPVTEARTILASGELGAVRAVRISTVIDKPLSYWRSGPSGVVVDSWRASRERAGGGVVLMNSIHQLDALRFMTGLDVVLATGQATTFTQGVDVEDTAGAVLRLENGALCTLAAAAHSPGARGEETVSIDCAAGRIDLPDPYGAGRLRVWAKSSNGGSAWRHSDAVAAPSHERYIHAFTDSVRARREPPATAWDAVAALATVEAIYESASTGRAVEVARYSR